MLVKLVAKSYWGTANGDGKVDVKDATLIQKYVVLMADIAPENLSVADYNKDGRIDVKDSSAVQSQY